MASEIVSQNKEMTQSNCVQWNLQTIGDIEVIHHIGIITLSKARWATTPVSLLERFITYSPQEPSSEPKSDQKYHQDI